MLFPDAQRSGIVPNAEPGTIPGLQGSTEEVLRCAREKAAGGAPLQNRAWPGNRAGHLTGRAVAWAEACTLFPDAQRSGIVPNAEPGTIPGLQRSTEEVLRCAREKAAHRTYFAASISSMSFFNNALTSSLSEVPRACARSAR